MTITAQMPGELSTMVSNDVASMYPSSIRNTPWSNAQRHKFQFELDAISAYHFWEESRSRKDLMKYLAKKWLVKNHKKLYPEEYV